MLARRRRSGRSKTVPVEALVRYAGRTTVGGLWSAREWKENMGADDAIPPEIELRMKGRGEVHEKRNPSRV